jgi:hypothetical protein
MTPSQPPASWQPNLTGLDLPRPLTQAIQQSFSLVYSLRDTSSQTQTNLNNMIQYGTHLARTETSAQSVPDGALWFETDRPALFYQSRMGSAGNREWFYAGGILIEQQYTGWTVNDKWALAIWQGFFQYFNGTTWVAV